MAAQHCGVSNKADDTRKLSFACKSKIIAWSRLITDFTPGIDQIDLRGFTVSSEQVVATETISQGSTHLALPDGEKITLLHITDLSPKDFTQS